MKKLCSLLLLLAVACAVLPARAEELPLLSPAGLEEVLARADRPALVCYWASWCVPCRKYHKTLAAIRARYSEKDFLMLGVAMDADPSMAKSYADKHPFPYPVYQGDAALLESREGLPVPTTRVYDRQGKLVKELIGNASEKRVDHYARLVQGLIAR